MSHNFESVKVGDRVIIVSSRPGSRDITGKVSKVLKSSFYVQFGSGGAARYWKKNGNRVGDANSWYSSWAVPYTEEHYERAKEAELRDEFQSTMRTRKWHNVPTATMVKINKLLEKYS